MSSVVVIAVERNSMVPDLINVYDGLIPLATAETRAKEKYGIAENGEELRPVEGACESRGVRKCIRQQKRDSFCCFLYRN